MSLTVWQYTSFALNMPIEYVMTLPTVLTSDWRETTDWAYDTSDSWHPFYLWFIRYSKILIFIYYLVILQLPGNTFYGNGIMDTLDTFLSTGTSNNTTRNSDDGNGWYNFEIWIGKTYEQRYLLSYT